MEQPPDPVGGGEDGGGEDGGGEDGRCDDGGGLVGGGDCVAPAFSAFRTAV